MFPTTAPARKRRIISIYDMLISRYKFRDVSRMTALTGYSQWKNHPFGKPVVNEGMERSRREEKLDYGYRS